MTATLPPRDTTADTADASPGNAAGPGEFAAAPIARPMWRRGRLWVALGAVVVVAAVVITAIGGGGGRALDPTSSSKDGSKALAVLLRGYGRTVRSTTSVDDAAGAVDARATVVVTAPDDYSTRQLRRLRDSAGLLVLIAPGSRPATALVRGAEPRRLEPANPEPGCADAGAQAAGDLDTPGDARTYARGDGTDRCYGGLLITGPKVVILGAAQLLRNDHLGARGVAALDVNVLTAGRRIDTVRWLLPGSDAASSGPTTIWALFPAGVHRLFWWLLALAALLVLWRARRFGQVVSEPLPVLVRSAEIVEGHGRLYQRAAAREHAAGALRSAAVRRLAARLALPPGADAALVAAAVADAVPLWQRSADQTHRLLADGPIADDAHLLRLACELDGLTDAVRAATGERRPQA